MENHFDKLFGLVLGIIYLIISSAKKGNDDEELEADKPSEYQPTPTIITNRANTWEDGAPATRRTCSKAVKEKMLLHPTRRTTPQLATQKPPSKKIDRVLRRYSSWKKSVVMAELLHPRT